MYISQIQLKNVRCCEDLQLSFDGKPGSFLVIGDNGDGKSTVLSSIAMGLCDETSAAALHRDLPGDLVRNGQKEALIRVTLRSSKYTYYKIETTIESLKAFEKVSQKVFELRSKKWKKINQDEFPWEKIFVSGYGAGIRTEGTADYQYYVPVDAVYPLFKYDMPLQNPELALRRILDEAWERGKDIKERYNREKRMRDYILRLLKSILNLEKKDRVLLSTIGLEVKSPRWGQIELSALGDGYKAITTCTLDLFSWWMLYLKLHRESIYSNRNITGIVIIDEMEQHLHPRWQLKIVQLLRTIFPQIQFIIATHSPLVISGCKDTPIYQLHQGKCIKKSAYGWLPEDVYREIMGLVSMRPKPVRDAIEMFEKLHLKSLRRTISKEEKAQLRKLRKLIHSYRGADTDTLMKELGNLAKELNVMTKPKKK